MNNQDKGLVLVTGGSGYLGGWIIGALLKDGYRVRTTVRRLARENEVRASVRRLVASDDRLSFAEADLLDDRGWETASQGAHFVLHVASPMQVGEFRNTDVIRPAREGTLRVLRAAAKAGVRRVVVTSSSLAAEPCTGLSDETVWTDLTPKTVNDYTRAKTLAERDAWSFAAQAGPMELATVLPGFIQGPVLGPDYSGSVDIVRRLLIGEVPVLPRVGFSLVDVRDLADLHVRAMVSPEAAGQRFIGGGEFLWFADIAAHLRKELGAAARKVPTRTAPDWLIRFAAIFQPDLRQITGRLSVRQESSSAKAKAMLGWTSRRARESVADAAHSLIAEGLI